MKALAAGVTDPTPANSSRSAFTRPTPAGAISLFARFER
jgi:hypothetical protein